MKKVISGILALVIAVSVASATVAACHRTGRYYVDANGDGVCDYYPSNHTWGHGHGCGFRGGCHPT